MFDLSALTLAARAYLGEGPHPAIQTTTRAAAAPGEPRPLCGPASRRLPAPEGGQS